MNICTSYPSVSVTAEHCLSLKWTHVHSDVPSLSPWLSLEKEEKKMEATVVDRKKDKCKDEPEGDI